MKNVIMITLLVFISAQSLYSQSHSQRQSKFSHAVFVGYNIGGLAPVSFPNNIRKINSYSPGFAPGLGYEINYALTNRWGIGTGVRADWKSMKVKDQVQYFHTLVSMDNSSIEGDFSGTNTTNVKNFYLAIPVTASYSTTNNWRFNLGLYVARLMNSSFSGSVSNGYLRKGNSLGEKITIDAATFDFASQQRKFDFGLTAGANKLVYKKFAVKADLQWGLIPVFPGAFTGISFKMYNIFATLGFAYHF